MAESAATRPPTNASSPRGGMNPSTRVRWPSDAEAIAELRHHVTSQGRRFYMGNLGENFTLFLGVLRRQSFGTGGRHENHTSWLQLAAEIWPDVDLADRDDARRKFNSLRRWSKLAGELGMVNVRPSTNRRGQNDGIIWTLTWTGSKLHSGASADVAQLAEGTSSCGVRRRQETPTERERARIRPWDRRGGQKVAKRFEKPPRRRPKSTPELFLASRRFGAPLVGAPVPTGLGGPDVKAGRHASKLAVHTAGSSSGAPPAVQGRNAGNGTTVPLAETAAAGHERRRQPQRDRSAELAEAMTAFEKRFGRASLPIRPSTFELWQTAAQRGELYGGWGVPKLGLALQFLVDRIESWDGSPRRRRGDQDRDVQLRRPAEPKSIAYFVALLDDASKHWRHAYRHEHGLCRRPELCRANAWMYPALDDRLRNTAKWIAYDRELEHVRRTLNDVGQGCAKPADPKGATC